MVLLLIAIVLMSLGDLYMTLMHLTNVGLMEENPLARGIIRLQSAPLLAIWKILSIALGAGILFVARRRLLAEVACWFCLLVMTWLTVRWIDYSHQLSTLTPYLAGMTDDEGLSWVSLQ